MALMQWSQIFLTILSLSLSGALAGALILLMHPLTEKVFSKKWNYYIWCLVILRLLIPVQLFPTLLHGIDLDSAFALLEKNAANIETIYGDREDGQPQYADGNVKVGQSQYTDGNAEAAESQYAAEKMEAEKTQDADIDMAEVQSLYMDENLPENQSSQIGEKMAENNSSYKRGITWKPYIEIAGVLWLFGAVIVFLIRLYNYYRFTVRIGKHCEFVGDERLLSIAEDLSAKLKIRRMPSLYESSEVVSPVTIGLWENRIILPKEKELDIGQYKLILHHELIHVARRDLWYKWLYQILLCIYWFCPLFYWIGRQIEIDCELACDEAVLMESSQDERKVYGNMLLDIAQKKVAFSGSGFSTMFMKGKRDMKRRLNGILFYKKQTLLRFFLSVCAFGMTMFLTACGSIEFFSSDMSEGMAGESSSENESASAESFSDILDGIEDQVWETSSNMLAGMVNKRGEAWKVYEDEQLLAGEDQSDLWRANNYSGGGNKISASSFAFNGSDSVRIVYATADTDIQIDSSFDLQEGKFKVVHVDPEGSVTTVNETGEETSRKVTMKKGRNVIKIAGQGAKLKTLQIRFSGLEDREFEHVYYAEEDEYAGQIIEKINAGETIEKEKVREVIYYMDEADVSEVFRALLNQGDTFNKEELCYFFLYSDAELSGNYLVEAVEGGVIKPLDVETLLDLMIYLDGNSRVDLLNTLPKEDFFEALESSIYYLSDRELEKCLMAYFEEGGSMSFEQFRKIEYCLSEDIIKKIDEINKAR